MKTINGLDYKGIDSGGTVVTGYVTASLNIGDWNMDTSTNVVVAHGLSATEWKTVRNISAIIRNDADTLYHDIGASATDGVANGSVADLYSTSIVLVRTTGGAWDNTDFDSTSYNRGWITFIYKPD